MLRGDKINEWLKEAGLSESEVQKLLAGGLAGMFDQIYDAVKEQVAAFNKSIKGMHKGDWTPAMFQAACEAVWENEYSKFMKRNIFDLFVRVAEQQILPGSKLEGHFRSPSKKNVLEGKSGDPFQDLCMALFTEAQERHK